MADENQKNGDAVSTRTPRRSAAGNKAWQALMPHHKKAAEHLEEEEEEEVAPPPPVVARSVSAAAARAAAAKAAGGTPAAAAATPGRKPAAAATPARATAAAAAPPPPSLSAASSKGMSDEEELEEASAELFPKPPPDAKRPPKRKGRPPKNGYPTESADGSEVGSGLSTPGGGQKKVKLEDAEDYEMDDEEEMEGEEDDYGMPPMLNRQTSRTPYKRACSPTCTKRCCLTEDGKRVSRQTTTGVRSDQYDPPYNARAGGKRKPRAPKLPSETPQSAEKKARGPYGASASKLKLGGMSGGGGGTGHFVGSSAPGARSMQAVTTGRAVSTMPIRMPAQLAPGQGSMPARVVTVTATGKVQTLSRAALPASNMPLVARPRVGGSGTAAALPKYPVAQLAGGSSSLHQGQRLPGPQDLLRQENQVEANYKDARSAFAKHVVSGSAATEFNRVIDLLTVENKRLIAAQDEDQQYVDSLHRKIRALENNVASLQRQLNVTTKAYHASLLETSADNAARAAAPAPSSRVIMQPVSAARPVAASAAAAAGQQPTAMAQPKMELKTEEAAEQKPKEEEEHEQHEGEGGEEGAEGGASAQAAQKAPVAVQQQQQQPAAAASTAAAGAAAGGRAVPRLMDQQAEGRSDAAAAMMINRQQWMNDFDDEEEMYDELMEEVIEEEEIGFFEDEEEEEDNMGLD